MIDISIREIKRVHEIVEMLGNGGQLCITQGPTGIDLSDSDNELIYDILEEYADEYEDIRGN